MFRTSYGRVIVAELSAFPAAALASAWLVGDVSYPGKVDGGLDYAVHPLAVPQPVVTLVGAVGLAVLLAAVVLVWSVRRARVALACVIGAGIGLGVGYRIVTAGVIGANIGAGLVFVLLGPIVLALLVVAVIVTIRFPRPGSARLDVSPRPAVETTVRSVQVVVVETDAAIRSTRCDIRLAFLNRPRVPAASATIEPATGDDSARTLGADAVLTLAHDLSLARRRITQHRISRHQPSAARYGPLSCP